MSENYLTTDGYRPARKPNPTGFLILVILAAAVCAVAVYMGGAPIKSLFPEDWIGWSRTSVNWAIALGAGALVLLISAIGMVISTARLLMTLAHPKPLPKSYLASSPHLSDVRPVATPDRFPDTDLAPFPAVNTAPVAPLVVPAAATVLAAAAAVSASEVHAQVARETEAVAQAPKVAPVAVETPVVAPVESAASDSAAIESAESGLAQLPHSPLPHALELDSLEPAVFPDPGTFSDPRIFSDNASDSFMTRPIEALPVASLVAAAAPSFDSTAALSDTHGLHVAGHDELPHSPLSQAQLSQAPLPHSELPTAQIIQLHPDVSPPSDPLEAALLADGPAVAPRHVPPSDMNAVISSAMSFIAPVAAISVAAPVAEKIYESLPGGADTAFVPVAVASEPAIRIVEDHSTDVLEAEPQAVEPQIAPFPASKISEAEVSEIAAPIAPVATVVTAPVPEPVAERPPEPIAAPVIDPEAEVRQVSQTVLSVWPDATRAIAADELNVRLTRLYNDPAPESQKAFKLLGSGDLSAATNVIAAHADALDAAAANSEAAEMWRIYGALHMGRDDPKALLAYEHVSELDPSDANIHVYLARRYQMAGDTVKQPAVISRALAVVTDPATRAEFLPAFADLKLKAGEHKAAGDALEELSRLQETATYLKPDDVAAKSAYAITVARLAQTREMSGQYADASPMYMKAYQAFSLLSQQKPDHAGLKAMAENALKDYNRLTQTV